MDQIPADRTDALSRRAQLLTQAGRLFAEPAPLEERCQHFLQAACELLGADGALIREVCDRKSPLLAAWGAFESDHTPIVDSSVGAFGELVRGRRAVRVDKSGYSSPFAASAKTVHGETDLFDFAIFAGMPMMVGGEVVGVLGFYQTNGSGGLDDGVIEDLSAAAGPLALAIVNLRLHRDLMTRSRQLQALVTEREHIEKRLAADVMYDELTGLPTRPLFFEHVQRSLARAARQVEYRFSIAVIRVSRYRVIVDTIGPHIADLAIQTIVDRIFEVLLPTDILARIAADQFAVLLEMPEMTGDIEASLGQLLAEFGRTFHVGGRALSVTIQIGIVRDAPIASVPEDLLSKAEAAQLRAMRDSGNSFIVYSPEMHYAERQLIELEADIRRGMDADEFRLFYQPIVAVPERRLAGFEVLLRWNHPVRGIVSPDDFIFLAENSGFIYELGRTVLRQACIEARKWMERFDLGSSFFVSVNVSPLQMAEARFESDLFAMLQETSFDPRHLKLEITESAVMAEMDHAVRSLESLREQGIGLCIDDFGTGFSSLGRLYRLPFGTLKIDRTFVSAVGEDEAAAKIVAAITSLARNLGLSVIAEGVENETQAQFLAELGAEYLQGFLLSQPLSHTQAEEFLSRSVGVLL